MTDDDQAPTNGDISHEVAEASAEDNQDPIRMAAQYHAAVTQIGWAVLALSSYGLRIGLDAQAAANPIMATAAQKHLAAIDAAFAMIGALREQSGGSRLITPVR